MFWDFISLRPESIHTTLMMFADRGIPKSYRKMHGYSVNTYAFVNAHGNFFYCKFHYFSNQGWFRLNARYNIGVFRIWVQNIFEAQCDPYSQTLLKEQKKNF